MGHLGRSRVGARTSLGDVDGLDVVELGCGTAYFSAWLARRGARPVGVDITPAQLETARRMQRETGIEFPLVEADAGATGLPDASASTSSLSEYGASIWVDPYRWIPEAARLLRPGGRLVFLRNSTLVVLCSPTTRCRHVDRLQSTRSAACTGSSGRARASSSTSATASWIDLLRGERLRDRAARRALGAARRARRTTGTTYVTTLEWAQAVAAAEEIWVARKR